jgi:hypothetical protein
MSLVEAEHFFIMVGRLLDDARLGRLEVRLVMRDGTALDGVPDEWASRADGEELDDTGYVREVAIGGVRVDLAEVRQATVVHPESAPG